MVFAHGFGCDQTMWRYVAPAFEHDFETILFDYVGAGGYDVTACDQRKYAELEAMRMILPRFSRRSI
jgi:sigma-B regulation protein RsbQ